VARRMHLLLLQPQPLRSLLLKPSHRQLQPPQHLLKRSK